MAKANAKHDAKNDAKHDAKVQRKTLQPGPGVNLARARRAAGRTTR